MNGTRVNSLARQGRAIVGIQVFVRFEEGFLIQLARGIFNEKFLEETQTCSSETTQIGSVEHTECHSLISVPMHDGERKSN